jgi:hypothetical protein
MRLYSFQPSVIQPIRKSIVLAVFITTSVCVCVQYKSRVRVFLNEATVSENRNGLGTEILLSETKPALRLDLLLV